MKKKTAVLLIVLAACMAFCSACGFANLGKADENFPYDIAVREGYTGSEGSWLAENTAAPSTMYYRMWEEAKESGYAGTYLEFLKELDFGDDSAFLQNSLLSTVSIVAYNSTSSASAGSGVILDIDRTSGDMDVITNYHVVYSSTSRSICSHIELYLYGGELPAGKLTGTFLYGSSTEDIAVVHVDGRKTVTTDDGSHTNAEVVSSSAAVAADIGDSDSLLMGEKVYAIGNPEAWGISVVEGVISVDAETVTMDAIVGSGQVDMLEIRTDAVVNHGNSGGGLFNASGELIGIVNARSEASGVEGVGYALPINRVLAVAENLRDNNGDLLFAKLGITVETADSHSVYDAESGRTFVSEKLVVKSIDSGSAAEKGGLNIGDTFLSMTLNGKTVQMTRSYKISNLLLEIRKGDTLTISISRRGEEEPVTLTVVYENSAYFKTEK